MRMEVSLQARLEQKLRLAPQIIQSIEILQLPTLELQDLVKEALEENPTLEEGDENPPDEEEAPSSQELEEELDQIESVEEGWSEYFSSPGSSSQFSDSEDPKREAMQNTAAPTVTLPDYLVQQLHLLDLRSVLPDEFLATMRSKGVDPEEVLERIKSLAEFIIFNLDGNGYLHSSLDEIVETYVSQLHGEDPGASNNGNPTVETTAASDSLGEPAETSGDAPEPWETRSSFTLIPDADPIDDGNGQTLPVEAGGNGEGDLPWASEARQALRVVQTLDPPGVGGRSLREVLLLQLDPDPRRFEYERKIIENHLEDIQSNRFPKIAKTMGSDLERVKEAINFIRMLNPRPGSLFASKTSHYIVPDVVVEEVDGEYEVRLEDTYIPRLHISPHYRKMLTDEGDNPKVREFIKKKLESAKWLIESIEQRQSTLLRICREIVRVQRGFLDFGLEHLKPLKMQHIADRVGVHVSTVSRALSDKYVQTPRGIYPLKFFFTGGTVSQNGTMESTVSIKQKVKDIVGREDKTRPLSDEEIARILRSSQGLDIARRTVTKYRKQLAIPSSRQRRKY